VVRHTHAQIKDLNKGAANDVGWRLHSTQQNNIILQLLSIPLRPSKAPDTCFALPPIKGKVASKRFGAISSGNRHLSHASCASLASKSSHTRRCSLTLDAEPAPSAGGRVSGPQTTMARSKRRLAGRHSLSHTRPCGGERSAVDELRARPSENSFSHQDAIFT
jgi:hypothetical protein